MEVDVQKLASKVAKAEFGKMFETFDDLCQTLAESKWATKLNLNAQAIGRLIISNKITTKVEQPKRGRGRPKRTDVSTESSKVEQPKRGRGRPKRTDTSEETQPKVRRTNDGRVARSVSTPAGPPPVRLTGNVEDWVEHTLSHGINQGITYRPEALVYWLRYFYDVHSPEYQDAKQTVLTHFGSKDYHE